MKKIKIFLLLIVSAFMFPVFVNANTCPKINADLISNNASYFNAADYSNVNYCNAGQSMQSRGCFALSMATILDTYYNNTSPEAMGSSICNSGSYNNDLSYGSILADSSFQNSHKIKIQKLNGDINSINTALENNTMILASIKGGSFHHTNSVGHYIILAFKDSNGYYVLNTGARADNGYYSETDIINNVVNKLNMGLYQVSPTDCSNSGSNSGTIGGTTDDPYPEYDYPDFGGGKTDCTNIFKKPNGELNDFGEFVQSIFTLIKIMAPVLVIILSTIDYVKAIASSNADEVKKANGRTIKRIIIGVLIFFLPFLLDILFHLFGLYDLSRCDIG